MTEVEFIDGAIEIPRSLRAKLRLPIRGSRQRYEIDVDEAGVILLTPVLPHDRQLRDPSDNH
jgi:hypothetical protein